MRLTVIALSSAVVLSACGGSPSSTDRFGEYDEALATQLMDDGLSESAALFLAMTKLDVLPVDGLTQHIVESFPTGNSAKISVTILPDQVGAPGWESALTLSHSESDTTFTFSLEYFVAYDAIPDEISETIRTGSAVGASRRVALAGSGLALGAGEESGVGVVVEGVVNEANSATVDSYLEFLDKKIGPAAKLQDLYAALQAALSVNDSLAMSADYEDFKRQFDELANCAANPTNALTKKAYQDDPGYKERILQQIESARSEVAANTAVMYIGLLNSTASGLAGAKWLAFVVGPATAWSKETLGDLNNTVIADLKESITSCEQSCANETQLPAASIQPADGSTTPPTQGTGGVCQPPAEAGTFTITGTISFHEVYSDGLDGVLTTDATVDVRIRGSETECCQDVESIDGSRIRYVAERSGVCTWRAEREGVLVPADEGAGTGEVGGTLSASPYGDELVLSIQVYGASYVESCPTGTYDGHSPIFYVSCGWATSLVGRSNGQNPASYDFSCAQTGTLGDGSGPGFSHQVSGTLTTSR